MKRKGKPIWLKEWQRIHGSGNKKLKDEFMNDIKTLYEIDKKPMTEIGDIYEVKQSTIRKFMIKHGIKIRTKSQAAKCKKKTIGLEKWRLKNGSWCKGLTKNDPRMAALIEKGRQTQVKNGKSKGKNNPMWGKLPTFRAGFRKDLGHYVRSSWEANFARIIIALNLSYEYEKHTFELSDGSTYTPDFYLPKKDKFYEVKGYDPSGGKHIRFAQEYPNIKLVVINERKYSKLMKIFGDLILIEDSKTRYTKLELSNLFVNYVEQNDCRPSVVKFCKSLGISKKNIIKLFGSEKQFVQIHEFDIKKIETNRLVNKYLTLSINLKRQPTRKEFWKHYIRACTLTKKIFGSINELKNYCKQFTL